MTADWPPHRGLYVYVLDGGGDGSKQANKQTEANVILRMAACGLRTVQWKRLQTAVVLWGNFQKYRFYFVRNSIGSD